METPSIDSSLEKLRNVLLSLKPTGDDGFEGLLATALSEFSGLTIRLAKSGSQFGRDGRSPSAAFAIAMEAKRYSDELSLEDLAGKAAVAGHLLNDSVDVWALGATAAIGDDTLEKLTALLEDNGVTLLSLDWTQHPLPRMAVLMAATQNVSADWLAKNSKNRDSLHGVLSDIAGHPAFDSQVSLLLDEVTAAKVGLGSLRLRADAWLSDRLRDPLLSQVAFGQYLTVAVPGKPAVSRPALLHDLECATTPPPQFDRPLTVAVFGPEGVGKSWLVAQSWLGLAERPIMLIAAGNQVDKLSVHEPLESIARLLSAEVPFAAGNSQEGWLRRLRRWKAHNWTGHLRFVLVLDGLNEQPKRQWADLTKSLSNELRALGGIVIVTCRTEYWNESVRPRLPDSIDIRTVEVVEFNEPEMRAALSRAGVSPDALPPEVRNFVRNPRVCALAVKLLDRLLLQPCELTVDRLLFEYWRQRLEERGDLIKHTIVDLEKLLRSHARAWLQQPSRVFDRDEWDSHSGVARRLGPDHVINDVAEIENGRFLRISPDNTETYEFRKEALPYALALLINSELKSSKTGESPRDHLDRILDPVRGFDIAAEVVEASVRLACLDASVPDEAKTALVRAWLTTQNVTYDQPERMSAYVRACPTAFLRAAELPADPAQPFIHRDLLLELLTASRHAPVVQSAIADTLVKWLGRWSRRCRLSYSEEIDAQRQATRDEGIAIRLASMKAEELAFFRSVTFEEVDVPALELDRAAMMLIAGRPLSPHANAIVGWSFAYSIASDTPDLYDLLAWIIRLNPVDFMQTQEALRSALPRIDQSSSELMKTAASIVLRLLGSPDASKVAEQLNPTPAPMRWTRVEQLCNTDPVDPSSPRPSNLYNARNVAMAVDKSSIWSASSRTIQDSNLEDVTTALARFDPAGIVPILRSIVATASERSGRPLRSLSWKLVELSPLFDEPTVHEVRLAYERALGRPANETPDFSHVAFSLAKSLMPHLAAIQQLDLLLTLPQESQTRVTMRSCFRPLPAKILEERLESALAFPESKNLLPILFFTAGSVPALTCRARVLIATCLRHSDPAVRACASECVARAGDSELDELMLASDRCQITVDTAFLEQYRDAAETEAIVRGHLDESAHRVSPRFLGFVAEHIGGSALALYSECLGRMVCELLGTSSVPAPSEIEIRAPISDHPQPNRFHVTEAQEEAPADLRSFVTDINNPDAAAERLIQRHKTRNERAAEYVRTISGHVMMEVGQQPPQWGLKDIVRLDPARVGSWLEMILRADGLQATRQIRNLAASLASAYSVFDADISARVFAHVKNCRPNFNVEVEPEGIPLYEYCLFDAQDAEAFDALRRGVFAESLNDNDLEMATLTAEVCGAHQWLDRYAQDLLRSTHPADQARGRTILGFRQPNSLSEQVLTEPAPPGFLGQVTGFASEKYRRAAWTRHWLGCLQRADNPVDFWRFGTLAEATCDLRFVRHFPEATSSEYLYSFGIDLYASMKSKAQERSKRLRETLFGLKAPEREIAEAIYEGRRPLN